MISWDIVELAVMVAELRGMYELLNSTSPPAESPALSLLPATCDRKLTRSEKGCRLESESSSNLPPQVREWKSKELKRYKEAQERKWQNWMEVMFEPKS